MDYVVTQEVGVCREMCRFLIPVPKDRGANYRQHKSMYWFRQREQRRIAKNPLVRGIYFKVRDDRLHAMHLEECEFLGRNVRLQNIECKDVFDFYDKIGYCRKSKKFLPHSDVEDERQLRNAVLQGKAHRD